MIGPLHKFVESTFGPTAVELVLLLLLLWLFSIPYFAMILVSLWTVSGKPPMGSVFRFELMSLLMMSLRMSMSVMLVNL